MFYMPCHEYPGYNKVSGTRQITVGLNILFIEEKDWAQLKTR